MKLKRRNKIVSEIFEQKEIVTVQPKYDLSKLHPDRAADGGSAEARRHGFIDTWAYNLYKAWKRKNAKEKIESKPILKLKRRVK